MNIRVERCKHLSKCLITYDKRFIFEFLNSQYLKINMLFLFKRRIEAYLFRYTISKVGFV